MNIISLSLSWIFFSLNSSEHKIKEFFKIVSMIKFKSENFSYISCCSLNIEKELYFISLLLAKILIIALTVENNNLLIWFWWTDSNFKNIIFCSSLFWNKIRYFKISKIKIKVDCLYTFCVGNVIN